MTPYPRRGFITAILLIIAAIVLLGYFKINIQTVASSPTVQANLQYAWQLLVQGMQSGWNYLLSLVQIFIH